MNRLVTKRTKYSTTSFVGGANVHIAELVVYTGKPRNKRVAFWWILKRLFRKGDEGLTGWWPPHYDVDISKHPNYPNYLRYLNKKYGFDLKP